MWASAPDMPLTSWPQILPIHSNASTISPFPKPETWNYLLILSKLPKHPQI